MGSVYCSTIKFSIFGESHGKAVGIVLDGFPAGMKVDYGYLTGELIRRRPKNTVYSTKRKEDDIPEILSGVKNGITTGSPICMQIINDDAKSADYDTETFRPSHADYTGFVRYNGFNDQCGGGHFSGRLTAPYVLAGALCRQYLREKYNVNIYSHIKSIGGVNDELLNSVSGICDYEKILRREIPVINAEAEKNMLKLIKDTALKSDSVGGTVECMATGLKAGLGSPNISGVESRLAMLLFAIPAVKGLEFGKGFELAKLYGSEANDEMYCTDGKILTVKNNNGGILGGITNGMPLNFLVAIKPTPSIGLPQKTVNKSGENIEFTVKGRHDPCIVPRAVPVIENITAIALLDMYLEAYGYENN